MPSEWLIPASSRGQSCLEQQFGVVAAANWGAMLNFGSFCSLCEPCRGRLELCYEFCVEVVDAGELDR